MQNFSKTNPQPVQNFGLLDKRFQYVPAVSTDIRKTWEKFGWTPTTK